MSGEQLPPRYRHGLALREACRAAFDAAGLDQATVTSNPLDIPSGAVHGVLVIAAPDLTFPTFDQYEETFEGVAIAGPADNLDHAWLTLDRMVEALLQANLNLRDATADTFTPHGSLPLAGYAITFNPDTVYKETS